MHAKDAASNLKGSCESTSAKTTQNGSYAAKNAAFLRNFLRLFCVVAVTVLYSVAVKTAKKRLSHVRYWSYR